MPESILDFSTHRRFDMSAAVYVMKTSKPKIESLSLLSYFLIYDILARDGASLY